MMRRYATQSVYNMRDLGGYPTTSGLVTRYGKIFRSDCPESFSENDLVQIKNLGIQTVIDLRVEAEILKRPSYYAQMPNLNYLRLPFKLGHASPQEETYIPTGYFNMMTDFENMSAILKAIANSTGQVLYHCAVGKDRTGIVTAILLKICEVAEEDIIADYTISDSYLHNLIMSIRTKEPEWPSWMGRSKPEYMREALYLLNANYPDFSDYLCKLGISEEEVQRIRVKLLI